MTEQTKPVGGATPKKPLPPRKKPTPRATAPDATQTQPVAPEVAAKSVPDAATEPPEAPEPPVVTKPTVVKVQTECAVCRIDKDKHTALEYTVGDKESGIFTTRHHNAIRAVQKFADAKFTMEGEDKEQHEVNHGTLAVCEKCLKKYPKIKEADERLEVEEQESNRRRDAARSDRQSMWGRYLRKQMEEVGLTEHQVGALEVAFVQHGALVDTGTIRSEMKKCWSSVVKQLESNHPYKKAQYADKDLWWQDHYNNLGEYLAFYLKNPEEVHAEVWGEGDNG